MTNNAQLKTLALYCTAKKCSFRVAVPDHVVSNLTIADVELINKLPDPKITFTKAEEKRLHEIFGDEIFCPHGHRRGKLEFEYQQPMANYLNALDAARATGATPLGTFTIVPHK